MTLVGGFGCLEQCLYGLRDLNQSEHSIWMDLDQWEASTLLSGPGYRYWLRAQLCPPHSQLAPPRHREDFHQLWSQGRVGADLVINQLSWWEAEDEDSSVPAGVLPAQCRWHQHQQQSRGYNSTLNLDILFEIFSLSWWRLWGGRHALPTLSGNSPGCRSEKTSGGTARGETSDQS